VPADGGDRLRLVVVLHGAGGDAFRALELWRPEAEEHGLLLLAPTSAAATWDVITGGYGPDVRRLDRLLVELAGTYPLGGLSISGFSDGASYALSLALANGNVFDSCVAFSPGFTAALEHVGRPRFFISHGTGDRVLPIDRCSRRIVPRLKEAGYDVEYQEFPGGHEVPRELRSRAAAWVTA
jgi:predicted esterase